MLEQLVFGTHRVNSDKLVKVQNNHPLLLVAYVNDQAIGFKLGYTIPGTRTFFSWLGGVHADYRRRGIAQRLLDQQENEARKMGLDKIYFTSFHRFAAMISLGQKNGYVLVRNELDDGEMKFWYEKVLSEA